jgi:hypothetical protein
VKTIEEYAIELVADGAAHVAEDDLNEDGAIADEDHQEACDLALAVAAWIRGHGPELLALVRAEKED